MPTVTNPPPSSLRWSLYGWLVVTLVLLWWPDLQAPSGLPVPSWSDLVVHVLLFVPGGFLLVRSRARGGDSAGRDLLLALMLGCLLALLTEGGQAVVPGRDPSLADAIADLVGIVAGWWVERLWPGGDGSIGRDDMASTASFPPDLSRRARP